MASLLILFAATSATKAATSLSPSTIVTIVIDDLGHYDTAVWNPNAPTPALKALADGGIRLGRHYTYKYCSPTRRSFLTGRLPIHMTGAQANPCTNWLPLEFTILPQKLLKAGFESHVIGKGHWGYQTMDHLPVNRGFKSHVGYLCGAEDYDHGFNEGRNMKHDCSSTPAQCVHDMWHDDHAGHDVIDNITYSTNYYARTATAIIDAAPATQNLGLFLLYQGVHVPYQAVPAWESKPNPPGMWDQTYSDMLRVVDDGVANLTAALHRTKRWENTLLVVTSDNGGIMRGNNYPLRGLKATVWEGGTKVMAFIAGGFLEAVPNFETHLKGTTNERLIHVSDWYATFSTLVGVDPSDDVVYDGVVRAINGIDVWPLIVAPATEALALASGASFVAPQGHNGSFIAITEASGILDERWKIIQNAQSTYWYTKNSSHINDNRTAWPCRGNKPGPSPSPSPPKGKCNPADEVPGFTCSTNEYCGPSKSFFWSGKANLTTCSSMCAKGTQGNCECFDWQGTDVGGVTCRLHGDATHIEHSGNGWSAYASNGADAREWIQTRAALAIRTTATMATGPNAADFLKDASMPDSMKPGAKGSCNVCTNAEPCVFDLHNDPEERVDLSKLQPALTQQLQAALLAAKNWSINGTMNADVLKEKYDCVTDTIPWWGNFSGPCCKPKAQ